MALADLFADIADAIREKDGTSSGIVASTFPARIRAIPTGIGGIQLESISITAPPAKTEYIIGDVFDPTGMVVTATYSNGQTMNVDHANLTFDPSGALEEGTESVTVNFQWGLKMASASQPITVVGASVFGVCWDYSNSPTALTRLTADTDPYGLVTATVDSEPAPAIGGGSGSSPFDHFMPWAGMEECNIIDGEVKYKKGDAGFSRTDYDTMVYVPKFWYQCIDDAINSKRYWYVSDAEIEGLELHPGSGKYIARYMSSTGYISKSNASPIVNVTIETARNGVSAKGIGWYTYNLMVHSAVGILYLIEFSDWNAQKKLGSGIVHTSSTQKTGGTDGMIYHTGSASAGGNIQYRGIEGIYGNAASYCDGVMSSNYMVYASSNPIEFNHVDNYQQTGINIPSSTGYITRFGFSEEFKYAFIPTAVGGSNGAYVPDQCIPGIGNNTIIIGGGWGSGDVAGLFIFQANHSFGWSGNGTGIRAIFDPSVLQKARK